MRISLLLVLFFACSQLFAQRLENIHAEAINGGEQVTITYDLTAASSSQKYKVAVYSSHNNYASPLTQISGDVNDVTPGTGKRIIWNARVEMVEYSGDVTFELRADPVAMALTVKTPTSVKKGKSATINYEGVAAGENVKLELIKSGVVVNQVGNTSDPSKYTWTVPADIEKASDYQIRLTAGNRTATSGSFPIKAKTKPIFYIIPAAVVVGLVVILATKGGGGKKSKDLPSPPDPDAE